MAERPLSYGLFEAHITLDPITDNDLLIKARAYARRCGFSLSDEPLYSERLSRRQAFMTGHSDDFDKMRALMEIMVHYLKSEGCTVNRYKIEHIVLDSRTEDSLGLLP